MCLNENLIKTLCLKPYDQKNRHLFIERINEIGEMHHHKLYIIIRKRTMDLLQNSYDYKKGKIRNMQFIIFLLLWKDMTTRDNIKLYSR